MQGALFRRDTTEYYLSVIKTWVADEKLVSIGQKVASADDGTANAHAEGYCTKTAIITRPVTPQIAVSTHRTAALLIQPRFALRLWILPGK